MRTKQGNRERSEETVAEERMGQAVDIEIERNKRKRTSNEIKWKE
jgi:hypothetical protein